MEEDLTDFSAREPALGYFYQIRYGLYVLLSSRFGDNTDPILKIENLDDIEVRGINKHEILQTKLKVKSKANLTDASVDFWKTMRIWSNHIKSGRVDLDRVIFNLITTERTSETSILKSLTSDNNSVAQVKHIITRLDSIASTSENQTNAKAYEEYLNLDVDEKEKLISRIQIIDGELDANQITRKIKSVLAFSSHPNQIDAFLETLEGWWFQRAIKHLMGEVEGITFNELQYKVADIRDSFSQDNLPNHFTEQLEITNEEAEGLKDKTFIKQLDLIALKSSSNTVKRAISDFRRAYGQKSKWLRQSLLNLDDQQRYDERLYDHWRNLYELLKDECEEKTVKELQELGKAFYIDLFVKSCPQIKIKEKFNEDYYTRGSFQMLADQKRIGWHPNFNDLLE